MSEFEDQLRTITELREHRRECAETLYRYRIDLHRTDQQLRHAEQQQTVTDSERNRAAATLRANIARLDAQLASLREENRGMEVWLALVAEQDRLIRHLDLNLTAAQDRNAKLREQLAGLRQQEQPSLDTIRSIETEVDNLENLITNLDDSLAKARVYQRELQNQESAQLDKQQALQSEMETIREKLREVQGNLTALLRPSFADRESLQNRHIELTSASKQAETELIDCDLKLNAAIDGLYRESRHPRRWLRNLDDRTPFLLFPVKLETIFVPIKSPRGTATTELWVRIYPDEIAIHTHEKTLTNREVVAGELYWTELVTAEHLRTERDNRRRSAWRHLVDLFGGQRAAWVARQTKPSDWETLTADSDMQTLPDFLLTVDANFFNDLLAQALSENTRAALQKAISANDGDAFSRLAETEHWFDRVNTVVRKSISGFPVHDLIKTDGWTRAPRTQVMPDRFVLLLYGYGKKTDKPREITGAIIPDTLFLGPDPMDAKSGFKPKDNVLTFAGEFDWMSDFDKAVEQGMGFRVALTEEEAVNGFERILALGVFLSADANDSAKMLEELIDNHQFSPKGFSLVPQGTPTNNTERNGTGYSDNDSYNDLAFFTGIDPPAFDPTDPDPEKSRTDGRLLADALGIAYAPLQTVRYADQTDVLESQAMNTALFPGTLGYWLKTWMTPVVTEKAARQTRSFFTGFVSGRGPLPAIRVGNQPYGVLLTSDFSRWKYPEADDEIAFIPNFDNERVFLKKLHGLLAALENIWSGISKDLPFVGKKDSDSSIVLMNILGLHPTSVEFFQRIGFSDEELKNLANFKDNGRYWGELLSLLHYMPNAAWVYLDDLGFEQETKTISSMRSLHVLWQHYVTPLDVPNLVENIPPSETKPLSFNYLDWLAKATSTDIIIKQNFKDSPPTALLYLMLRNGLLLQLHHGAYQWLTERTTFEPMLEQSLKTTTLLGMRAKEFNLSKFELMATPVNAADPLHPSPATSVADWIWLGPDPVEIEAAFLREQKSALPILANASTAKLERCFIEHLDCCNYRLDAWQTGLFAQRLQAQRESGRQNTERQMGIYLGAFGWVENLKPLSKTFLNPENLPSSLRPKDSHPVIEEDDVLISGITSRSGSRQGGFVHTPSLNHASAAALLRNAYLSHANPEQAEMFSVNLSSERVRRAEFILEGMRNGQPIEALLGYQFERGLHDRTSESANKGDATVLELNQFILSYRQEFPFESREVAQSGSVGAVETVPANSVVNGLRLAQAALSPANGYGLNSINPPVIIPDASQGLAILAEQNRLLDSLDAVKDLLMAENAYQLVLGNFDRVAAVSLAQKDAHIPPDLQVINTPRGTEFTFTNRVTLHFDDLDPSLSSSNPWPSRSSPMTPRAYAETGMNHWLGQVLGIDPEKVHCSVYWIEKNPDGIESPEPPKQDSHIITLMDLGIQPIDFVWMVGISPEETHGATELETRIAFNYRRVHNIADDRTVRIEFNHPKTEGEKTFAQLFPLARQLRALLGSCRALNALDFLPASGGKATVIPANKNNPKGYDQAELRSRVQSALASLEALADALDGTTAPMVDLVFINDSNDEADDEVFTGKLGEAYKKLEAVKLTFTDANKVRVQFSLTNAETLHQCLRAVANFGIADAFPPQSNLVSDVAKAELLARAHRVARRLRCEDPRDGILDRAKEAFNKAATNKTIEEQVLSLLQAGKFLFGETFDWLPKFTYHNEVDLATADAARDQLLKHAVDAIPGITKEEVVEEWLQGLARVRPNLHRWEVVRTLTDTINDQVLELNPAQIPFRANDSWLAVEFPEKDPNDPEKIKPFGISRDTLSIAAHGASAFKIGARQSGILLDDWTEEIPTSQEITGISFRFNQPNATPPQALLLAVTPEETGSWNWDDLVGTLNDTLDRAKRRAVEPEQLEQQGLVWNALWPAMVSEFSTLWEADVYLDQMLTQNFAQLEKHYTNFSMKK
jgi:hypothetical protein